MPVQQRKTMFALQQCRTAALGGHVDICNSCGHTRVFYNSCRNRHCPRCQGLKRSNGLTASVHIYYRYAIFILYLRFPPSSTG
ncbi:MAG: transposase zinc-binding domain-containing protein [Bacteroidetes bacterium]|nr:transposase zinc-binding domain-containing protein [Bacteroidota bacterium]